MQSPGSVQCSGKHARLTSVGGVRFSLNTLQTWQESELGSIAMRYVFFTLEPCLRVRVWAAMPA